MIDALTACLSFEILVHVLNIASAKARAKTVFGYLKANSVLKKNLKYLIFTVHRAHYDFAIASNF